MIGSKRFFRSFWPWVGPAITEHYADTGREVRGLLRLVRLRPRARILDVPCGYGRHALELAQRGFRVTGVDISPQLLARAREAAAASGVAAEFHRADMRRLRYRQRFDAALNLFSSFGYFGDAGDLQVLKKFRRALRPEGRLVLHLATRDWSLRKFQPRDRSRMGEYVVTQKRSFDFETSTLTMQWTARRGRQVRRGTVCLRLYSAHELVRMLKQARFSEVKVWGDWDRRPVALNSRRLVIVGRR